MWEHISLCDGWSPLPCVCVWVLCTCRYVCASSIWRSAGLPRSTLHVSMCGTCGPLHPASRSSERIGEAPCSAPEWFECGTLLSVTWSGVCAWWEVMADLCSLVLSFQWCADRWSLACFYSLCFSLSFFIPSSSSSHSAIKQNKLSSLRSARRLVLFTSYPSTVRHVRWDFPVGRGEPSRKGEGALQTLAPFQARPQCAWWNLLTACCGSGDGINTLLACLCCLRFKMHVIYSACKSQPGHLYSKIGWEGVHAAVCGVFL